MSIIKKEIGYIKGSFSQIFKALVVFLLFSSGLFSALLLRLIGANGTLIAFLSIVIEIMTIIISYFFLRKYIGSSDENQKEKGKVK